MSLLETLANGDPNLDRVLEGFSDADLQRAMQTCRTFYRAITWKRPRLLRYFDGQWQPVRVDLRRLAVAGREAKTASVYPMAPLNQLRHVSARVCTLLADAKSSSSTLILKTVKPEPLNGLLVRRGAADWQHFLRGDFVLAHGDSFALDVQKINISAFGFASYEPRLALAPALAPARLALDARALTLEAASGTSGGEAGGGGEAGPAALESGGVADAPGDMECDPPAPSSGHGHEDGQVEGEEPCAVVEIIERDHACPAERAPGTPGRSAPPEDERTETNAPPEPETGMPPPLAHAGIEAQSVKIEVIISGSYFCFYREGSQVMYLHEPRPQATLVVADNHLQLYVGADCKADVSILRLKNSKFFLYDDNHFAMFSQCMTDRIAAASPRVHAVYGHGVRRASFFYLLETDAAGRAALREALQASFAVEFGKPQYKSAAAIAAKFPTSLVLL